MRIAALLLTVIVVAVVAYLLLGRKKGVEPKPANVSDASERSARHEPPTTQPMSEMRDRLLRGPASAFGIDAASLPNQVWGCIMETGFPEGRATLVALADGSTSLYYFPGGGTIGGGDRPKIASASKAFVRKAADYVDQMYKAAEFPMPQLGRVRFYVLTTNGVFTAEANEDDLGYERHKLSPLFHAGHDVITEVRLVIEP